MPGRQAYDPPHGSSAALPGSSGNLLMVFWRSRWILVLCTVVALVAGFAYIAAATPIYAATAKLYLDYENISISQSYGPGVAPRTDKYLHTQAERLASRPILAAALTTLGDQPLRTFAEAEVPVAHLHKRIAVTVGKKDETVSISLRSPYPVEAAQIVNTVVDAYMTSRSEDERQDATKIFNILQAELKLRRSDLEEKRRELKQFQADDVNDLPLALGSEPGGGIVQSHLEYQSAYDQAKAATIRAKQHLDAVQDLASNPVALRQYLQGDSHISGYATASREQTSLEARFTELELRAEQLLKTFTADHPAAVSVAVQMKRIRERLDALNDQFVNAALIAAQRQYAQAQANEQHQATLYGEQSEKVRRLGTRLFQYRQLLSEVGWLQTSAQKLEQQVDDIRKLVGEDVGQMRMAILEPAQQAEEPSWPQKPKVLTMALFLGLFLGGSIGVGRDWLDQTLHSADEIVTALELPVLGVVPAISRRHEPQTRGRMVSFQPDSPEAEAFRTIRTAVFFGASKENAKTLLITSPSAGDGKSTLVSNLGIAMANAGQKVLILDADLRRPMQHVIFDVDHEERSTPGVLAGKMKLATTQVDGLSLLVFGHGVPNPAELLNSPRFAKLLSELAGRYDRILVDAPPVTVVTDAQILGAICDYAILVLKADKSTRRVAQRAIDALQHVGTELLGVVVNEVKNGGRRYGYYGRYAGSYSTGSNNGGKNRLQSASVRAKKRRPLNA